jgi:hypothetical protein
MIPTLILAFALVAAPADATAAGASPPDDARGQAAVSLPKTPDPRLAEKITLDLKMADLRNVLEQIATLLGATPIIEPGAVGGSLLTMNVRDASVGSIIERLETSHGLSIRLEGRSLLVSKRSAPSLPSRAANEITDRELLEDPSLPRRRQGPPPALGPFIELRPEGSGASSVWAIKGMGRITLPGCNGPTVVAPLSPDYFDGLPRLAFLSSDPTRFTPARIVTPGGAPFRLSECPFTLTASTADGAAREPDALRLPGQFLLRMRLLEVSHDDEVPVVLPNVVSAGGLPFSVRTGARTPRGSAASGNEIWLGGAILDADDRQAIVALSVNVMRDVDSGEGSPSQNILLAHAEQSLRVTLGQPERLTVSSTWGRGRSALVLELTVEPVKPKP